MPPKPSENSYKPLFMHKLSHKVNEELEAAEIAFLNGELEGLHQALRILVDFRAVEPSWVLEAALELVKNQIDRTTIARGAAKATKGLKAKRERLDRRRWRLVNVLMTIESTQKAACTKANEILSSHGDPPVEWQAIRSSWSKVERLRNNPKKAKPFVAWMYEMEENTDEFFGDYLELANGFPLDLNALKDSVVASELDPGFRTIG